MKRLKLFRKKEQVFLGYKDLLYSHINKNDILEVNLDIIAVYFENDNSEKVFRNIYDSGFEEEIIDNHHFLSLNKLCLKREFLVTEIKINSNSWLYNESHIPVNEIEGHSLEKLINKYEADIIKYRFRVKSKDDQLTETVVEVRRDGVIVISGLDSELSISELLQSLV